MCKPGLVIFFICSLLVAIGLIVYFKANAPKISVKAKLVLSKQLYIPDVIFIREI